MIKNTVKLMMATTLATALVVVVTESADAQISGHNYSRGNAVPDLEFDLIFETSDGEIIPDQDEDDSNNTGLFSGAIRNFSYLGAANPNPSSNFNPLSFRFDLGDLSTRLEGDTVTYTIISQSTFQLKDSDEETETLGTPTIDINPGSVYTFELNVSGLSQEVKNNYVNSLQFIIENNLYNPENFQSESFVRETFGLDLALPGPGSGFDITDIPDTTPSNPQPVPEPNTSIPSLLFGAFSLGLLIKRKMKMKQVEQFQG
jgi:hypothetical protein